MIYKGNFRNPFFLIKMNEMVFETIIKGDYCKQCYEAAAQTFFYYHRCNGLVYPHCFETHGQPQEHRA